MKRFLVVLVFLAMVSPAVEAQKNTANIRGTVTDPAGDPVAGAAVTVLNVDTGFSRSVETNDGGAYLASSVPVGTYLVTVESDGFKSVLVQNIVLNAADNREVNAQLEVGDVSDEITVTSSAIVVETIGGEVAGLITGEELRELPLNGRNFLQLTTLMPGVAAPDGFDTKNKGLLTGSDLSVSGGGVTANVFTVDGANNNDVGSNRTVLVYPSVEALEEFKIHRNSYGAEFGGAGGAQINLVTRGGTNELQGSVFYFARRDDSLERSQPRAAPGRPGHRAPQRATTTASPSAARSRRTSLHFFGSMEFNDETRGVARSAFVPTAAEKRSGDFSQTDPACSFIPVDPRDRPALPRQRHSRGSDSALPACSTCSSTRTANASIAGSCTNWVEAVGVPIDWDQINARLDWQHHGQPSGDGSLHRRRLEQPGAERWRIERPLG